MFDFLTELYEKGFTYSDINTARSALSSFVLLDDRSSVGIKSIDFMSVKRGFPVQGPKIKVYRSLGCSDSVVQILVWEFYHNENRNMNASLSEKAWRFLHVNVLKVIPLLGLFLGCLKKGMTPVFFFFPEYSSNDFASFRASMSSTYL